MGETPNTVKDKWNRENYRQIKISVRPEVAGAFKSACKACNVSMASELSGFMEKRAGAIMAGEAKKNLFSNRGGRRKLLNTLIGQLEQIKEAEEGYLSAIPENLLESVRYENAEQSILAMEEALDILKEAY